MTSRSRSTVRTVLRLLLLVGFIGASWGCAAEQQENNESRSSKVPVRAVRVEQQSLQETVKGIGTLVADETVRVQPEITGIIKQIHFAEGDSIQEGDLLFTIEHGKLLQQFRARKSALQEAEAQLENARGSYQRLKRLFEKDLVSAQERDNALEAYESAQARVNRLKAEVREARQRLEDSRISSPFDGYVGERVVDTGNLVQPGEHLVTLYKTDRIEVSFTVPERFVGRVRSGQSVKVKVSAYPNRTFTGNVFFVSPSVRESTRDLLVKAHVSNPKNRLKPGTFTQVELLLRTLPDRPVIPSEALVTTRDGYVTFVVKDGVAHRQPVRIGLRQPGVVEIREGLSPNQIVVRQGHMAVSDGSPLEIQNKQVLEPSGSSGGVKTAYSPAESDTASQPAQGESKGGTAR